MKYQIVEKDIKNEVGFLHPKQYDSLSDAYKYVNILKNSLAEEYYDIFVVEVE
jgi:hypothetical protein